MIKKINLKELNKKDIWTTIRNFPKTHPRFFIRIVVVIVLVIATQIKIGIISLEKDVVIPSFYEEYNTKGFPVSVDILQRSNTDFFTNLTLIKGNNNNYTAWVKLSERNKLRLRQRVIFQDGNKIYNGTITFVANTLNYDYGLYQINVSFNENIPTQNAWLNTEVVYLTKNTYSTSNENISCDDGKCFIWYVKDNKAYRQEIIIGERDLYKSEIIATNNILNNLQIIISDKKELLQEKKVLISKGDK